MTDPATRLRSVLESYERLAVAVSGGVDSLTLAHCAARWVREFVCIHAVSPAVPPEATDRVHEHAKSGGWRLKIISSGEFGDPEYRANPHNRCYFCKTNLYATMRREHAGPIASGTNADDLGDFRPGLIAASEHDVVHPYVEAGLGKSDLREIAREFGLDDIAGLPAQPCLASRVQTGIRISRKDLGFIHRVESALRPFAPNASLRCRVIPEGVRIESDEPLPAEAVALARQICAAEDRSLAGIGSYTQGSAFIRPQD